MKKFNIPGLLFFGGEEVLEVGILINHYSVNETEFVEVIVLNKSKPITFTVKDDTISNIDAWLKEFTRRNNASPVEVFEQLSIVYNGLPEDVKRMIDLNSGELTKQDL